MDWTNERLTALSTDQLKTLRENAEKRENADLAQRCDEVIAERRPKRTVPSAARSTDDAVMGFHFVCPKEHGVIRNSDGTLWTGTWVVAKEHAERASQIGAYVALHTKKSEPSYLQGTIRDSRRAERARSYTEGQEVQTEYGYDFLFEPTASPYEWVGDASGEKGYAWTPPRS